MSAAKKGRPTLHPRLNKISIRIDDRSKNIIDEYCKQENVNKTEAINRGIHKLEADIKK